MGMLPRFSNRRRIASLVRYALRRPFEIGQRVNATNIFLARQFSKLEGSCNICGARTKFWFDMPNRREREEHKVGLLRESLYCTNCNGKMRERIIAQALITEVRRRFACEGGHLAAFGGLIGELDILDTDQFSPQARMFRSLPRYLVSGYVPENPAPILSDGVTRNVDLQKMPFDAGTFDVILSADVLEHVRDLDLANSEIKRCLKPGGVHIFTVPFDGGASMTRTLVAFDGETEIYLAPPQIHGDALSGGIVAYRVFGGDLPALLVKAGFEADMVRVCDAGAGIFDGLCFLARKPLS